MSLSLWNDSKEVILANGENLISHDLEDVGLPHPEDMDTADVLTLQALVISTLDTLVKAHVAYPESDGSYLGKESYLEKWLEVSTDFGPTVAQEDINLGVNFSRADFQTVGDGLVIRYRPLSGSDFEDEYEISAGRDCVLVTGTFRITTQEQMSDLFAVMQTALKQHYLLKSGIGKLMFRGEPSCVTEYRKYQFPARNYEVIESRNPESE